MKLDAALGPLSLAEAPALASAAEAIGLDALWTSETQHDPLLPLALVAQATTRLRFGTAVAIAFARSPTVLAHTAWDLAAVSRGRFILGLGTQVRPHIERRFGMPWPASPAGALREYVDGLRAVWRTWQSGERLNQRGDQYRLSLMTPFFSPAPIDTPEIPIYLAGVNRSLCRLAGEVADGLHVHPLHSAEYLRERVLPAVHEGARRAGREAAAISLSVSVFTAADPRQADFARSQIAFYASTPSYRPVMDLHGRGDTAEELSALARRGAWDEMPALIDDDLLHAFAVVGDDRSLGEKLRRRYQGLAERVTLYRPFRPGEDDPFWRRLVAALAE